MGYVIEDTTAAPTTGYVIEDSSPAPKPKLSAGETFTGGMTDILSKLTLGAGDEIVAGGSAIVDDLKAGVMNLFGGNEQPGNYDQRLEQVRGLQSGYQEEHPISSGLNNLAGVLMPVPKGVPAPAPSVFGKAGTQAPSVFKTAAKAGGIGAAYGGASGFASGEGGFENRLKSGGIGAAVGGAVGGAVPLVVGGVGKVAGYVGDKLDEAAGATREGGLGIQYGDRSRGLKSLPQYLDESGNVVDKSMATTADAPIEYQVSLLKKTGVLDGAPNNPRELKVFLENKKTAAGTGLQNLIGEADTVLGPTKVPVKYPETSKFLSGLANRNPTKAQELVKDFEEVASNYDNAGSFLNPITGVQQNNGIGALSRINNVKAGLTDKIQLWQKEADTPRVGFYRAIYRDLQALEDQTFASAVPGKAAEFQTAKEVYGALSAVGTTINKAGARKSPSIANALEGGSKLPLTIAAATAPVLGPGGATTAAGAFMVGRGIKNTIQNAAPLTTANIYEAVAQPLKSTSEKALNSLPSIFNATPAAASFGGQYIGSVNAPESDKQQSGGLLNLAPTASKESQPKAAAPTESLRPAAMTSALENINGGKNMDTKEPQAQIQQYEPVAEDLVQAVIMQESGGKKNAVSSAGAQGLMQLMPATGKEWHSKLGLPGEYDPFDKEQNKTIGTAYLSYLLDMYDGDTELALTAYNQGFGRVNKLLARNKGSSLADIIDDLGPDGRGYAQGVISKLKKIQSVQV